MDEQNLNTKRKREEGEANEPTYKSSLLAQKYLNETSDQYIGSILKYFDSSFKYWDLLTQTICESKPGKVLYEERILGKSNKRVDQTTDIESKKKKQKIFEEQNDKQLSTTVTNDSNTNEMFWRNVEDDMNLQKDLLFAMSQFNKPNFVALVESKLFDFNKHSIIYDFGGSVGLLAALIAKNYTKPNNIIVFDLPFMR